ncbi:MAG: GNAT family N-acetyltransferase [Byssovorax sp.]
MLFARRCRNLCNPGVDAANTATNVGYIFFPPCWGQGLTTEAVIAILDHLIGAGITRFQALVTAGNTASARVLTKAGFTFTRVIPGNDIIRGVPHDDEEYIRIAAPAKASPSPGSSTPA